MNPTKNRLLVRVVPEEAPKEGEAVPVKGTAVMKAEVLKAGVDTRYGEHKYVYFAPFGFDEVVIDGEKQVIIMEDLIIAYE